jgi:hypothetical protein
MLKTYPILPEDTSVFAEPGSYPVPGLGDKDPWIAHEGVIVESVSELLERSLAPKWNQSGGVGGH